MKDRDFYNTAHTFLFVFIQSVYRVYIEFSSQIKIMQSFLSDAFAQCKYKTYSYDKAICCIFLSFIIYQSSGKDDGKDKLCFM